MRKYTYYDIKKYDNLYEVLTDCQKNYGEHLLYIECLGKYGQIGYVYKDVIREAFSLSTSFIRKGYQGKHIALIGENCKNWVVTYLSVVAGVGVLVPLDTEMPASMLTTLINKCDAEIIVTTPKYAQMIKSILPECGKIIQAYVTGGEAIEGFIPLDTLIAEGKTMLINGDECYTGMSHDVDAVAEIVFTSGTTGANKGVMLSQRNILASMYGGCSLISPGERTISVLPMQHTFESICHIWISMYWGTTVYFNDSLKNLMWNIERFSPTIMVVVPLFLETIYKSIKIELKKLGMDKYFATGVYWGSLLKFFGVDLRRVFFKPILTKFGGSLKYIVTGGAPLNAEIEAFFNHMGIDILNGYGITECAPLISATSTGWPMSRTVGYPIKGVNVKILNPDYEGIGEVAVRGDNVMLGYYNDSESTKKTFTDDGWFNTGDLGKMRRDGMVCLSGRKKNLIVLSNGKNVHPEEVEEAICTSMLYVRDVLVFSHMAGGTGIICASLFLDEDMLVREGIDDVRARVDADIIKVNSMLPPYKRVQRTVIRKKDFERTSTKKVKRGTKQNEEVY